MSLQKLQLLALFGFVLGLVALGISRIVFRDSRGMSASQYLFVGLLWFILMVIVYIWMRAGFSIPIPGL